MLDLATLERNSYGFYNNLLSLALFILAVAVTTAKEGGSIAIVAIVYRILVAAATVVVIMIPTAVVAVNRVMSARVAYSLTSIKSFNY